MPLAIATGPDGNMWFTRGVSSVGSRPLASSASFPPEPSPLFGAHGIAGGPDGNVWFTEDDGNRIGRITPSGVIRMFSGSSSNATPRGIAAGPDGNMWFTEFSGRIGRITPKGTISEFPATAQFRRVRQVGMRVAVRLHCPKGNLLPCGGSVRFRTGSGGARRLTPLTPGHSTTVVIPISATWRRLLARRGRLGAGVWLMPEAHSMVGALNQPIVLRGASRPRLPAVTG